MRSYGDISPTTPFGRVIVVILIVVSLVIFPSQLAGLLDLVASIPRYRKKFRRRRDVQHVILVGGGIVNASKLQDFEVEFFHPDRRSHVRNSTDWPAGVWCLCLA